MAVNRPGRLILGGISLFAILYLLFFRSSSSTTRLESPDLAITRNKIATEKNVDYNDKAIIVASAQNKDTSWVERELPDWKPYIYMTDSQIAPLHVDRNKGNEANVYLSFIIANYHRLPATMVFVHHHDTAYHVDNMFDSNAASIKALQLAHVQRVGYASMRCMDEPGCICSPARHWDLREEYFQAAWPILFPGTRLPSLVQAPCCAQFAVSRAQVLARPLADYERMHGWLMSTELRSSMSGRIMEHLWHVVFGQEAVLCADERACYCDKFGICGNDDGSGSGARVVDNVASLSPAQRYKVPLRNTFDGAKAGFWPLEQDWLDGHKCAKWAGYDEGDAAPSQDGGKPAEQDVSDKMRPWQGGA